MRIDVELRMLHQLEAFGVRLHQAVLDPVVHHLHEVAGAGGTDVRVAALGRERLEDRLEPLHGLVVAADHEAEPDLQPPDTARDPCVDEVDAALLRLGVASHRVTEIGVAAVDDDVAFVGEQQQMVERILGDLAGGNHEPERAWRIELLLQLVERARGP
jgi:hypothetical protein